MAKQYTFVYGRPVRGAEFINRVNEMKTVFNRLRNGESSAITGPAHFGKTSFLLKLMDPDIHKQFLDDSEINKIVYSFIDLYPRFKEFSPKDFWQEALEPLTSNEKSWRNRKLEAVLNKANKEGYNDRSLRDIFRILSDSDLQLVLLIDEFDRLLKHPNFQDLGFYALLRSLSTLSGGLSIVITSHLSISQMNTITSSLGNQFGSPFFNNMIQITLRAFSHEVIDDWFINKIGIFADEEVEFIKSVAGPSPYLLQAMAATLDDIKKGERPRTDEIVEAASLFYDRNNFYFDGLWTDLDDASRTILVILSIMNLDTRILMSGFSFGEIEHPDKFEITLRRLQFLGLARKIDKPTILKQNCLIWRNENWVLASEAFAWWIRDVLITKTYQSPSKDDWIKDFRYTGVLSEDGWNTIRSIVDKIPPLGVKDTSTLARSLLEMLRRSS